MRKIFNLSLTALSLVLIGCNADEGILNTEGTSRNSDRSFIAYLEGGDTKTYLDGEKLMWSADETIGIFENYPHAQNQYKIDPESVGTNAGTFTLVSEAPQDMPGAHLNGWNVAFYPYTPSLSCNVATSPDAPDMITLERLTIPKTQDYLPVDQLENTYPMMAATQGNELHFRNVCGLLKFNLKGTQNVTAIEMFGTSGEQLCGEFVINMDTEEYIPRLTPVEVPAGQDTQNSSVVLDCGNGVQLSESVETTFTFCINPNEFVEGFFFIVTADDGSAYLFESTKRQLVQRSHALVMAPVVANEATLQTIDYGTEDEPTVISDDPEIPEDPDRPGCGGCGFDCDWGLIFDKEDWDCCDFWKKVIASYDKDRHCGRIYIRPDADGCVRIPCGAFRHCRNLEWIDIPDAVTDIEDRAFENCSILKRVRLPECLEKLGEYSFCNTPLLNIELPCSVRSIGKGAFSGCNGLGYVRNGSDDVPALGAFAFGKCSEFLPDLHIFVHENMLGDYKKDSRWQYYKEHLFGM